MIILFTTMQTSVSLILSSIPTNFYIGNHLIDTKHLQLEMHFIRKHVEQW